MDAQDEAKNQEKCLVQFERWYSRYSRFTMKSKIIELPREFVDYLLEDGIHLPGSIRAALGDDNLSDDEDDDVQQDEDDIMVNHHFPELDIQIQDAIKQLGGEVFPKLNWSCPLDASWINTGTLKCQRLADVYVLLKSSDRIIYDIEHTLQGPSDAKLRPEKVTLVLRKWANLHQSMEFRVFVHDHKILGISQRDCSTYYDFLTEEAESERIVSLIDAFFHAHLASAESLAHTGDTNRGSAGEMLSCYAMDVYIDKGGRVWIVDFNVFGEPTHALLFTWDELESLQNPAPPSVQPDAPLRYNYEFRVVESTARIVANHAVIKGPIDVELAPDFSRFMQICKEQASER